LMQPTYTPVRLRFEKPREGPFDRPIPTPNIPVAPSAPETFFIGDQSLKRAADDTAAGAAAKRLRLAEPTPYPAAPLPTSSGPAASASAAAAAVTETPIPQTVSQTMAVLPAEPTPTLAPRSAYRSAPYPFPATGHHITSVSDPSARTFLRAGQVPAAAPPLNPPPAPKARPPAAPRQEAEHIAVPHAGVAAPAAPALHPDVEHIPGPSAAAAHAAPVAPAAPADPAPARAAPARAAPARPPPPPLPAPLVAMARAIPIIGHDDPWPPSPPENELNPQLYPIDAKTNRQRGCPKCRYRWLGCDQCRTPGYTPQKPRPERPPPGGRPMGGRGKKG